MTEEPLLFPVDEPEDTFLRSIHRLFFDPGAYFARIVTPRKQISLYLLAFIYSLANAIDRDSISGIQGRPLAASWAEHWGAILAVASVGMFIVLWLGGMWYGYRLRLCGIDIADRALVKKVYLSAAQIYAIPAIVMAAISTVVFKNPAAAALGEPLWLVWVGLFFAVWSYWGSYVGVRTVFRVRRGPAAWLFLILPVAFLAVVTGTAIWLARAGILNPSGLAADIGSPATVDYSLPEADAEPPHVFGGDLAADIARARAFDYSLPTSEAEHSQVFENVLMTFSYPHDWKIEETKSGGETPKIQVLQSVGGAFISLQFEELEASSESRVEAWSASIRKAFAGVEETGTFGLWGYLLGTGRLLSGKVDEALFDIRLFVAPISDERTLLVMEMMPQSATDEVQSGLELVRRSFRPRQ